MDLLYTHSILIGILFTITTMSLELECILKIRPTLNNTIHIPRKNFLKIVVVCIY